VNKNCEEYIEKSRILYHISDKCSIHKTDGEIDLICDYDNIHIRTRYNAFGFHYEGGNIIYVTFSLESNEDQMNFSVMLNFIYYSIGGVFTLKLDDTHLYLNGDIFGIITFASYYHENDNNGDDSMCFIYKPTTLNDMLLFHSSNLMSK
jgi:hypothetical protein